MIPVFLVEEVGRRLLFPIAVTGTGGVHDRVHGVAIYSDNSLTAAVIVIFLCDFFFGIGDGIAYLYAPEVILRTEDMLVSQLRHYHVIAVHLHRGKSRPGGDSELWMEDLLMVLHLWHCADYFCLDLP